jgi:rod shape-determining protein MreD
MHPRTVQPLNPLNWLFTPAALCLAASLTLALPIKVFGLQLPEPVFAMAPAFAWAVLRPSVLPPFALVAIGILLDLLWGSPLGLWPLCLLVLYGLAFSVRRVLAGEDFWALGAWYGAICAISFAGGVLLTTLAAGQVPSLLGIGLQYAVTLLLYPLAWLVIDRFEDAAGRYR